MFSHYVVHMFVYIGLVVFCWWCMLPDMREVDLYCGLSLSNIVDVFCRKSRPCIKVATIDESFPCVLYCAERRLM